MITAIEIENFKAIGERVRVELKPLTLLFGPNSAGKSSIIHALLLGHEIFERHNLDPDRTVLGGDAVDLGGFKNFVHGHNDSVPVRLRFEFALADGALSMGRHEDNILWPSINEEWAEAIDQRLKGCTSAWVEIEVVGGLIVRQYEAGLEGGVVAQVRMTPALEPELYHLNFSHLLLRDSGFEDLFKAVVKEEFADRRTDLKIPFGGQVEHRLGILSVLPRWDEAVMLDAFRKDADLGESICLTFALTELIARPGEILRDELRKLRYLGPLREMPPRDYKPPRYPDNARWARGLAAWEELYQAGERVVEEAGESAEKEPTVAESAADEWGDAGSAPAEPEGEEGNRLSLDEVNEWLGGDRLDAGYRVDRKRRTEIDLGAIPASDADPDELKRFVQELRKRDTKEHIVLVPHGQSIQVQLHDVGTGVSQLLPVVVLSLAARDNLVAIEQPELHLHPALQTELGDLFIESALRSFRKNTLLIETHSEHLILRLLRRIRETTEPTQNENARPLRPDQVSVIYVEQTEQGVQLSQLRIDESGEFIDRWPKGFFEERADELF